jgi:hypothetical protein
MLGGCSTTRSGISKAASSIAEREMRVEIGKEIGKAAMDALMKGLAAYSEKLDALEGN